MSTTRGDNAEDADDFVKYANDGTFVTLSVSSESFNSNNNNKPNKPPKKKVKDKQRHCEQSKVSESRSNTTWFVPVCSEKSETQAECVYICRMCKSKSEVSEVKKACVEADLKVHNSTGKEQDLLDPDSTDDISPNTL